MPRSITAFQFAVLATPFFMSTIAFADGIDQKATGIVFPVKQDKDWACWAASGAMMLGWKNASAASIDDVLDKAGAKFKKAYEADTGLSRDQITGFIKKMGMKSEPLQCYSVKAFADLVSHGPLFVIYNPEGAKANRVRHAVVATGVKGDGSIEGTSVTYIDPADGSEHTDTFKDFMTKYEEGAAEEIKVQVGHF